MNNIPFLTLGNPDKSASAESGSVYGRYTPDGRVLFDKRPTREWEFMATGTGVTGLTVSAPDGLLLQVNHSAAIDEAGQVRALARLHLDLDENPFNHSTLFRMEHDLRRSLITVHADTETGPVHVEIRAQVPDDLIRIDILDGRSNPGKMTVRLEEEVPSQLAVGDAGRIYFWHENPAAAVSPPMPVNNAAGPEVSADNRAWLAGRVFGLVITGSSTAGVMERVLEWDAAPRQTLFLEGISTTGGWERFTATARERETLTSRIDQERFVAGHEAWWQEFWDRSWFEPVAADGSMLRHKAAFDLYRYYTACCAGEQRETPPRFQIELFRYHLRQHAWLPGLICAVEQYQSYYGALRTGDWGALRGLAAYYHAKLPYYRHFARSVYGHAGARIPMWQDPVILAPSADGAVIDPPAGVPERAYNGENPAGQIWILLLLCDYVDAVGDHDFARRILLPMADDLVEFIRLQYPGRDRGRMVIAPCNAGETWQGVRDPAEVVCALRATLPRLIAVARSGKWADGQISNWEQLLGEMPDIPRGRFEFRGALECPVINPGDLLVPAQDMRDCEFYHLPWVPDRPTCQFNEQQTELYAIWPAKLVLRNEADHKVAVEAYNIRLWQHLWHGWTLDVVYAACLGLLSEAREWFAPHFDYTFMFPCGLARETSPCNPAAPQIAGQPDYLRIPECPSLQGMGTGMISVLEMLLQDYPDLLVILPCWDPAVAVRFALYSPYAGKVMVDYDPVRGATVHTERPIQIKCGAGIIFSEKV
ncbi:MAG: DUF5703 domain-containing protein [Verrucomicrobiae bacterium]